MPAARRTCLPAPPQAAHAPAMFSVTEAEAATIRNAFDEGGEFTAATELRRIFPGIIDNATAQYWARVIAGWTPLPPQEPSTQ
jgi:hypothetical protein